MANEELELVPWEQTSEEELVPWEITPKERKSAVKRQASPIVSQPKTWEQFNEAGTGDDDLLGMPLQKGFTDEGEPRTYMTPIPMEDVYNIPGIGTGIRAIESITGEGSIQRTMGGGLLEAIKAPLELGEALAETVGLDPNTEKYIRENFPTMPASNNVEKLTQEIMAIVIGSAGGASVGVKLGEKLGPKAAQLAGPILAMWTKIKEKDPVNANKKFELFLKGLGGVFGEIIGSSITTPSDIEPISEDLGLVPQSDNNLIGNIVDNATFAAGLTTLAKLFKMTAIPRLVGKATEGFRKRKPEATTLRWLQNIDPDITPDLPPEEIARRAAILTDVIQKHSTFKQTLEGSELPIDTTTSMALGAQEYVRRAYDFREAELGAKGFNDFVQQKSQSFINQIITIKQALKETKSVAGSDAQLMSGLSAQFKEGASRYATPEQGNLTGQEIARPTVENLQGAQEGIDIAKRQVDVAAGERLSQYDDSELIKLLEEAKRNGAFANNRELQNLAGPQLLQAWQAAKARVDEAFANIPNQTVDPTELAQIISSAAEETNILQDIGLPATAGGLRPVDDIQTFAQELEAAGINDVQVLLSELRPQLSRRISAARQQGDADAVVQIEALRNGIDRLINKRGDPDIQRAFDEYKKFADTWLITPPLEQFDQTARQIKDFGGGPRGLETTYEAGMNALAQSRNAYSEGYLKKFVEALQSENPNANENLTKALIAEAFNTVLKAEEAGKKVDANLIWSALNPYLKSLETLDPQRVVQLREGIEQLRMADSGLGDAEKALENAQAIYDDLRDEANRSAAKFFIANLTGNGEIAVSKETGPGFKRLFDNPDSPNIVEQLLDKMNVAGDDLAIAGVKSEFLRYLQDRYFTSKAIGMDAEGQAIREASGARLAQALEGNASNDIALINTVFADEPDVKYIIYELMQLGNLSMNLRGAKPNPFGSNTTNDITLKQNIDSAVTMVMGPLTRTGARVRTAGKLITEGIDANRQVVARELMGMLSTNAPEAVRALTALKKWETGATIPSAVRRFINNLQRRVIRGSTVGFKGTDDDQTPEAFELDKYMDENKYYFDEGGYIRKQGLYSDPNQ